MGTGFSIHVITENLKFSAAHFIAYAGFREPLHGHNYQVGVRVEGSLAATGYVLDFGLVKKITRKIVAPLDERTIIPGNSDCLAIEKIGNELSVRYGNDRFAFPLSDVAILPIVHSSAEELARFIWTELRDALPDQTHSSASHELMDPSSDPRFQLWAWGGKMHMVPEGWRLPSTDVKATWNLWHFGHVHCCTPNRNLRCFGVAYAGSATGHAQDVLGVRRYAGADRHVSKRCG